MRIPADPKHPVRLFHLSFHDFLVDPENRDEHPFWVDEQAMHQWLARQCLHFLSAARGLRQNICELPNPGTLLEKIDPATIDEHLPPELRYACRYWVHHLEQSKYMIRDYDQSHIFLQKHALHWLEAMCIMGEASESINAIYTLQLCINVRSLGMHHSMLTSC